MADKCFLLQATNTPYFVALLHIPSCVLFMALTNEASSYQEHAWANKISLKLTYGEPDQSPFGSRTLR